MRRRTLTALATLALVAAAAPAEAAQFRAKLDTPKSQPKANKGWKITVHARSKAGKAIRATAYYQFLFQGQVVSTQYPSPGKPPGTAKKPYRFKGSYSDKLLFPPRATGIPLKLRVVVQVKGKGTVKLDKAVKVRR